MINSTNDLDQRPPLDTSWKKQAELYKRFIRALTPHKKTLFYLVPLFFGVSFIEIFFPFFVKYGLDQILTVRTLKRFYLFASGAMMLLAAGFVLRLVEQYMVLNFSFTFTNRLRKLMFAKIVSQSFQVVETFSPGRMMAKITYNIGLIRIGIERWGIVMAKQIILFAGVLVFSILLDWTFFFITIGLLPFFVLFTIIIQRVIRKYVNVLQTKNAQITEELYDLFRSWSVIKLFYLEKESYRDFAGFVDEDQFYRVRRTLIYAVVSLGVMTITGIIILFFAWYMLTLYINGETAYSRFLLYIFYTGYLSRIFIQSLRATAYYEAMKIGVVTTFRYIPKALKISFPKHGKKRFKKGKIKFQNIHFRYTGGKFRLKKMSLTIKSGAKILITGPPSSGKSSVLKLIKGISEPIGGSIFIDNIPFKQLSKRCKRESIAYISPEARFLEGSWLTNLLAHKSTRLPDSKDIRETISLFYEFGLQDIINKYRHSLNTKITSQRLLSTSETQLALALRSMRHNPGIILFDGFFSMLNPDIVDKIKGYIDKKIPGATIIYADYHPNNHFNYQESYEISNGVIRKNQ